MAGLTSILLLTAIFFILVDAQIRNYEGYQLVRVEPMSDADVAILRQTKERRVAGVRFLTDALAPGAAVLVLIPPSYRGQFISRLEDAEVQFTIQQPDVQKHLQDAADFSREWNQKLRDQGQLFDVWRRFASFPEIEDWLNQRASHSAATLINIGTTYEDRNMLVMQISDDPSGDKPGFWIDCTIHAREWITTPSCNFMINELLNGLDSSNSTIVGLVQKFDWFILPVANPDGYEETFTGDRYWRKTMTPNPDCYGTDGNRNYDYEWFDPDNIGSSDWGCDDTYRGEEAFSEPCTAAIRDFITPRARVFRASMSMHSFGSMWLAPFSHDWDTRPSNAPELDRVGRIGMNALMERHGNFVYRYGTVPQLLGYFGNGGSMDWAMGAMNIPYGYGMEFRGDDFVVDPSEIIPNAEEVWEGVIRVAQEIQI